MDLEGIYLVLEGKPIGFWRKITSPVVKIRVSDLMKGERAELGLILQTKIGDGGLNKLRTKPMVKKELRTKLVLCCTH